MSGSEKKSSLAGRACIHMHNDIYPNTEMPGYSSVLRLLFNNKLMQARVSHTRTTRRFRPPWKACPHVAGWSSSCCPSCRWSWSCDPSRRDWSRSPSAACASPCPGYKSSSPAGYSRSSRPRQAPPRNSESFDRKGRVMLVKTIWERERWF